MMDNTLNELISKLGDFRTEKKRLEYEAREIGKHVTAMEYEIMDVMDDQQIIESKNTSGQKVTLGEAVYPQVDDWDAFHSWILENHYLHFLEKRPAVLAYREALGQGIAVPGVLPFTKRKITFRET
ncbi:MAG: hypothetical protein DRR42_09855 [Gammaproteobacteria bacterium]|nr:MAG: hypothetical protein DRR42_09855 [Gammaproteobacteria bacterium]